MSAKVEIRVRDGTQPLVRMGDVGLWSMVRRADVKGAAPFVISRKDWEKLPLLDEKAPSA
jgi:hypothetical protein